MMTDSGFMAVFWFLTALIFAGLGYAVGIWREAGRVKQAEANGAQAMEKRIEALRLASVFADAHKGVYSVPASRRRPEPGRPVERQRVFLFPPAPRPPKEAWRYQ